MELLARRAAVDPRGFPSARLNVNRILCGQLLTRPTGPEAGGADEQMVVVDATTGAGRLTNTTDTDKSKTGRA